MNLAGAGKLKATIEIHLHPNSSSASLGLNGSIALISTVFFDGNHLRRHLQCESIKKYTCIQFHLALLGDGLKYRILHVIAMIYILNKIFLSATLKRRVFMLIYHKDALEKCGC